MPVTPLSADELADITQAQKQMKRRGAESMASADKRRDEKHEAAAHRHSKGAGGRKR